MSSIHGQPAQPNPVDSLFQKLAKTASKPKEKDIVGIIQQMKKNNAGVSRWLEANSRIRPSVQPQQKMQGSRLEATQTELVIGQLLKGKAQRKTLLKELKGKNPKNITSAEKNAYKTMLGVIENKLATGARGFGREKQLLELKEKLSELTKSGPYAAAPHRTTYVRNTYAAVPHRFDEYKTGEDVANLKIFHNVTKAQAFEILNQPNGPKFIFRPSSVQNHFVISTKSEVTGKLNELRFSFKDGQIECNGQPLGSLDNFINVFLKQEQNGFLRAEEQLSQFLKGAEPPAGWKEADFMKLPVWRTDLNGAEKEISHQNGPKILLAPGPQQDHIRVIYRSTDGIVKIKLPTKGRTKPHLENFLKEAIKTRSAQKTTEVRQQNAKKDLTSEIEKVKSLYYEHKAKIAKIKSEMTNEEIQQMEKEDGLRLSRSRERFGLKHSYTVIEDKNTQELRIFRHYHGKVGLFGKAFAKLGFIASGGIKEVFDMEAADGKGAFVRARQKAGAGPIRQNVLEFKAEMKNAGHVLIPKYVSWISKSGEKKESLIMAKMESDGTSFMKSTKSLEEKKDAFKQIALGLHEMHRKNWIHRDLKPANILIQGSTVKISDLDLVKKIDNSTKHSKNVGTQGYIAPELYKTDTRNIMGIEAGKKADIFSLGATFFEMFYGTQFDLQKSFPKPSNKGSVDYLIWRMVQKDPNLRPSTMQVTTFLLPSKERQQLFLDDLNERAFSQLSDLKSTSIWAGNSSREQTEKYLNSQSDQRILFRSSSEPGKMAISMKGQNKVIHHFLIETGDFPGEFKVGPFSGHLKNVISELMQRIN